MQVVFDRFFHDTFVQIALLLVILDVILGVTAAIYKGTFQFNYLADFLRNDVLGKVVPFFVLYGGYVYAQHAKLVIPGINLEVLKDGAATIMIAALGASLLNSLRDLNLLRAVPNLIAGDDPRTPGVPPSNVTP